MMNGEKNKMYMIPQVEETDSEIGIPIYGTDKYCWIEWNEEEVPDVVLGRAYNKTCKYKIIYTSFKVCPIDLEIYDEDNIEGHSIDVFEVTCFHTNTRYYLIAESKIDEYEDIFHCVCIPFNRLNLFKFYSEYLCQIGKIKYRMS